MCSRSGRSGRNGGNNAEGRETEGLPGCDGRPRAHPLVRQAEREGWGRDLRQHCIRVVRRQMGTGQPYSDLDAVMPDAKAVKHWREQAERYAKAAKFRAEMIAQYGDYQNFLAQNKAKSANRAMPRSIGQIIREMR